MTDLFATRGSSFQNKALTVASTAETVNAEDDRIQDEEYNDEEDYFGLYE